MPAFQQDSGPQVSRKWQSHYCEYWELLDSFSYLLYVVKVHCQRINGRHCLPELGRRLPDHPPAGVRTQCSRRIMQLGSLCGAGKSISREIYHCVLLHSTLHIRTEMGLLDVEPHEIVVIPRGIRFQVCSVLIVNIRSGGHEWHLRLTLLYMFVSRLVWTSRRVGTSWRSIRATSSSRS